MARDLFEEAGISPQGRDLFEESGIQIDVQPAKKKRSWSDAARDTALNFTGGAVSGLLQMAGNAAEKAYQQTTKSAGELVGDAALSGLGAINPAAAAMVERVLPSKADRIPTTPQEVRNARDAAVAHDQSTLGTLSNIWRDKGREIGQAFKSAQSQEGREMDAGLSEASGDGAISALSYLKDNPGALLNMMSNSAGYSLPIMAASAIGKQGAAMASNVGMSGLAGGSAAADETRQRLLDMPESQWQQSPQYAQLRKAGMDHAEAAAFLADRAASQAFNQAAVVSAGAGAITAPLEVRALRGGLSSKAGAINEAKALAQTVGKESAEEYLQEGVGEQLAQEMAIRDAGIHRSAGDVLQSVNTAGVLGAVAGAAQGGGVHAVGRAVNIADGNPNVGNDPNPAQDVQSPQKTRIMLGPNGRAMAVPVDPVQQQPAADGMTVGDVSPEQEANAGASAILDQLEQAEADSTQQPVAPIDRASAPNVSPEAPNLSDAAPNVSGQGAVSAPVLAQDEVQPAQPQVQPASPAVEPYAMPLQQFVVSQKAQSSQTDMPHDDQAATLKHADAIESALAEGKPVPPAALAGHAQTASRYAEYFPRLSLAVQEHAAKVAGIDAQIQKLTAEAATRSAPVQASFGRQVARLQAQKSELTGQPVAEAPAVAAAAQQAATAATSQRAADLQPQQAPIQQVVSNNPAAEPVQTKGRLTPLQDGRIAKHAQELQALAGESGWAEQGGKVIRDQSGNVTGRTKWIPNADWWAGIDAGSRLDQAASIKAVQKAVAGEPLTAKEKRAVAAMLDVADINERRYAGEPDIDSAPAMVDDESIAERQAIQAEAESAAQAVTDNELDQLSDAIFNGEEGTLTDDEIRRWLGEDAEAAAGRSAAEAGPGYQAGDNYSGSSEARPAGAQRPGVGGTVAGGDAQGNQGNEQKAAVTDDFALQSQTEQGLRRQDEERRNAAAAEEVARKRVEQKAQADAERDSFALTGSDRAADVGAANGQGGLFSVSDGFQSEVSEAIRAGLQGDRQSLRQQVSLDIKTPAVLQMLGVAEKPVFTNRDLIAKMHIEHGLTKAQLNDLPGMLDKPAMVFESDTQPGRFLVVTSVVAGGRPVVIAVEPNGRLDRERLEVVMLPSSYPRNDADRQFTRWIKEGKLLYSDKSASRQLATTAKLQLPGVVQRAVGFTPKKYKTDSDLQQYRAERGLYSFAGTSAATADTYALSTAQQRIVAGEDVETVRRETGWFKGADGKWRFEIDDSGARFVGKEALERRAASDPYQMAEMRLAEVLDHPALFAAYPSLQDVSVVYEATEAAGGELYYGANFNATDNTITLGNGLSDVELKSALLHEIQHGIQNIEGFASGGTEAGQTDISTHADSLQAIKDAIVLRTASGDGAVNDRGRDVFMRTFGREPVRFAESLANNNSADELRNQRNRAEAGGKYEQYHRLAGEVEARNVQARADMTAEQRRATPPNQTADVADQHVILVFNGKEMAHAPAIANGPNTAATLRATLAADELGSVATSLIKSGRIVLHDTQASFNPDLKFKVNGVTTADGKVHLIAENLTQKNAMAVLLHELFHLNGKNLIDTPNWTRLMQSLEQAMVMAKNTKGRLGDFYREAERRLEIAKRAGPVGIQAEEFGAYMIEHFEQAPASLRKLAEKIIGEVKAWLLRSFGMQVGRVTPGQLRAIARAALVDAAEHAGGDVRVVNGRLAYSRDGADRFSTDQKTLNVNGVDRPVLNADGKPIHNTQQGIINFWKWYDELQQRRVVRQDARGQGREGNREATGRTSLSSHFFDEQGRPKIFYHGTGAEVSEFDLDHPDKWDHGWLGKGVYLASDHELARFYSDQKHGNPNIMPLYAGVSNPYEFTFAWKQKLRNATPQEIAAVTDALMANGYDGGVLKFGDGSLEVVAFDNRAIKSAIGNTGAFDPANPDIRFSITDDAAQKVKDQIDNLRSPDMLDSIIYTMQDKLIDLRRMTEHMQKAGTLSERINAYLAEELYHGRVAKRHGDFIKNELRPLMAGVRAAGFTPQAFEEYLHARHAPERNAEMAKRNPSMQEVSAGIDAATKRVKDLEVQLSRASARGMATSAVEKALNEARGELSDWLNAQPFQGTEDERLSLSGMSDEQARQIMAKYTPKQLASLEALGRQVDAINESTLKTLETYGLETKEMLDKWRSAYAHYVPLHRDEAHPDSAYHPIGQGFSIKGGASKRATGSNEKVTNILGHLAQQREAALTRGEKNLVAQTLFMQIKALDDAGFAEVNAPKMRTFVDERTGFTRRELDNNYRNANNVMMLKVAGRDAAIMFNERNPQAMRMAGALKNMDATDFDLVTKHIFAPLTRYFSMINTQLNAIFGIVNLVRDTGAGALNLSTTPLAGKQVEVLAEAKNILRQSLRNGLRLPKQGKVAELWEDFQNTGGQTGYRDLYADAADRAKAIQKEFDSFDRGNAAKTYHKVADWLSDFNEAMENTIRLAAYKVALENGVSKRQAASLAKNLTVNFNRKGKWGRSIGAYYAFFNASVQGTTRMMETLRGPLGKKIIYGGMALGAIQTLIGVAMMGGGDDEDDEWAKIPEFVKERNLIIPISGKDYIPIPLPLGFHVIPNAGRLVMEAMLGRKRASDAAGSAVWSVLESFNPIGTSGSFWQTVGPTATDPVVALLQNKDWTGSSIYRENMSQLDPEPGHRLAKASASAFGHGVSRAVNWMTGGNEYRPGMVSWTPDQIDYVIGQITGGVGREMLKATQVVSALITGDELPAHKVPLLGRFYGNTRGVLANTDQFYTNLRDINIAENELKGRMKDGDYDGASSIRESDPLAGLVGDGNAAENMVRKLKQKRRDIQKRADDGWRDDVKAVDEQIASVMTGLNRQVREAKEPQK